MHTHTRTHAHTHVHVRPPQAHKQGTFTITTVSVMRKQGKMNERLSERRTKQQNNNKTTTKQPFFLLLLLWLRLNSVSIEFSLAFPKRKDLLFVVLFVFCLCFCLCFCFLCLAGMTTTVTQAPFGNAASGEAVSVFTLTSKGVSCNALFFVFFL